jgi:radical SAM protein (TIGR04043 family)
MAADLGSLLADVQSLGVRVADEVEGRRGGAGPSDAGMIWIEGRPVTFPFSAGYVARSPFELRLEDEGWGLYRDGARVAAATLPHRPRYYDLATAEGIPYWKIALLHLDSLASTVIQTCVWWGTPDQCGFCGIELSLEAGRTVPVKKPHHLAEVAAAAKELDGAVDVTLTTGTTRGADKGARYLGRCAAAIKAACGLPVQAQFEPPDDFSVFEEIRAAGVDSVGMHVETFDPEVLARVAGAKARTGVPGYFRAWERAVEVFGRGQVSTYVILGMGEDRRVTIDGIKRAVDIGVFPFVVPLRPVPGSLMEGYLPPAAEEVEAVYREVVPYLSERDMRSADVKAGCARCQACSGMAAFERDGNGSGRRNLPLLRTS